MNILLDVEIFFSIKHLTDSFTSFTSRIEVDLNMIPISGLFLNISFFKFQSIGQIPLVMHVFLIMLIIYVYVGIRQINLQQRYRVMLICWLRYDSNVSSTDLNVSLPLCICEYISMCL